MSSYLFNVIEVYSDLQAECHYGVRYGWKIKRPGWLVYRRVGLMSLRKRLLIRSRQSREFLKKVRIRPGEIRVQSVYEIKIKAENLILGNFALQRHV